MLGERDSLPSPEQLVYETKPNLNHPNQPPIVFACDPETGYIILATRTNWETYAQEWHVAGLRDLADALGIIVGSQFSSIYYPYAELENVNQLSLQQFNGAILEHTAWHTSEPQEGVFVFDIMDGMYEKSADAILANALAHKLYIRGDHIINPPSDFDYTYLRDMTDLTPERLLEIMKNHIRGVMNHFTGKINLYGVVNESRTPDELKPDERPYDMFNVIIGESYIEEAFRTARGTDPSAILTYNETRNETKQGRLYQRTKEIVDRLRPLGLIDGVGVQMHLDGSNPPRKQDVIEAFRSYGIQVYIRTLPINII